MYWDLPQISKSLPLILVRHEYYLVDQSPDLPSHCADQWQGVQHHPLHVPGGQVGGKEDHEHEQDPGGPAGGWVPLPVLPVAAWHRDPPRARGESQGGEEWWWVSLLQVREPKVMGQFLAGLQINRGVTREVLLSQVKRYDSNQYWHSHPTTLLSRGRGVIKHLFSGARELCHCN